MKLKGGCKGACGKKKKEYYSRKNTGGHISHLPAKVEKQCDAAGTRNAFEGRNN